MYRDLDIYESYDDSFFNGDFETIYYRMTGGLGNQIFGLLEARNLFMHTRKKILIDFAYVEHVEKELMCPFSKEEDWFKPIVLKKEISQHLPSPLNIGNEALDLSRSFFTGWRPNIHTIEQIGFFTKGVIPKMWRDIIPENQQSFIALHLRFGDYLSAKSLGGDITIDEEYVLRALLLVHKTVFTKLVRVFTDDIDKAIDFCSNFKAYTFEFDKSGTPLKSLLRMSQGSAIIASGSTFSFWSVYFSKQAVAVFPKPFYPSNPKWEDKLIDPTWYQISRYGATRRFIKRVFFL